MPNPSMLDQDPTARPESQTNNEANESFGDLLSQFEQSHSHKAEEGGKGLEGTVVADAFCHSMVRALVGAVLPVGQGRRPVSWPAEVLTAGRRDPAVAVMPPHGLSLEEVVYPPDDELAARAQQARAVRTL